MKRLILSFFCLLAATSAFAQKKAVTETGEEVLLHDDGKWEYSNPRDEKKVEVPINPKNFEKGSVSTFQLKSTKTNMGFWLNPKTWSFEKSDKGTGPEYSLKFKAGDLYAMILSEKIAIPLESFRNIALQNARKAAPDSRVTKEEYRMVNGLKVLHLQINGTIQGIKFVYYGYYYSNSSGTTQFVTYTAENLLNEYTEDIEQLINGLVEIKS
jgi:hypothetical protein